VQASEEKGCAMVEPAVFGRLETLRIVRLVMFGLAAALAIAYLVYIKLPNPPQAEAYFAGLFKMAPVVLWGITSIFQSQLGTAAYTNVKNGPASSSSIFSIMVGAGLLLSSIGDYTLDLTGVVGQEMFMVRLNCHA